MSEDQEGEELTRRIYDAWDKLPMPPLEWMERFEQSVQDYDAWRRMIDPTGKIKFRHGVVSRKRFNKMSIETRLDFLVNLFKLEHRQPNPN